MSNDRLTHPGKSQNFKVPEAEGNSNNQRLRSGPDESSIYRSEEHRQVYQHTSQSFNDQQDQYAEHAFNEPQPGYDYQKAISNADADTGAGADYKRYAGDSIFLASDLELAHATENYLEKDSESFAKRSVQIERRLGSTADRIEKLENNHLEYRNSYKFWKHRLIMDKERGNLKESKSWHAKGLLHKDVIHKENTTQIYGRLKFRSEKIALTEKQHHRKVRKEEMKETRHGYYRRKLQGSIRQSMQGSEFEEDELASAMRSRQRKLATGMRWNYRRNMRRLKHTFDGYERLKFQKMRLASLNAQRELLNYRSGIDLQRRKAEEAARQGLLRENKKRKIKKQMAQDYKRQQGRFFNRVHNQQKLKKTVKKEKKMARKRTKTLISSLLSLFMLIFLIIIVFFTFVTILINISGESVAVGTSQNDYSDMTEVTEYFRDKEAELEEIIKPENLEQAVLEQEPEIYEFIYHMAEISFDSNTLVAYLSAKYNEFDLAMVKAELDEIFELYYTLKCEIKEEYRMLPDTTKEPDPVTGGYPLVNKLVKICYVTLEKADFYELLQGRIEEEGQKNQMDIFYLTGNGQQIYGPVMNVDWRNKISSNFGNRVHPITGAKSFHDGVDIAVPTGTSLYSAVKGTVVISKYSESAGNMITVQTDSGWTVTFMHMESRAVSVGDQIEKGQYVGTSGNTGNSTGPHLHLQVHDAGDQPVNPVFIIPYSTLEASETFN